MVFFITADNETLITRLFYEAGAKDLVIVWRTERLGDKICIKYQVGEQVCEVIVDKKGLKEYGAFERFLTNPLYFWILAMLPNAESIIYNKFCRLRETVAHEAMARIYEWDKQLYPALEWTDCMVQEDWTLTKLI